MQPIITLALDTPVDWTLIAIGAAGAVGYLLLRIVWRAFMRRATAVRPLRSRTDEAIDDVLNGDR